MENVSGLAYGETSLLFPDLPNPVILDVASTQPHHLDAIILEPRVIFDGQQQLCGELLQLAGKVRLLCARLPHSFPFFSFFCPSLMHCTITFTKNGAPPRLEYNFTRFLI